MIVELRAKNDIQLGNSSEISHLSCRDRLLGQLPYPELSPNTENLVAMTM